jgi:hypothetical protein
MKFTKVWLLIGMGLGVVTAPAAELFDMAAIRDASTLDVKVLKDWYPVRGEVMTRQKLITIRVGELVPGKGIPITCAVDCTTRPQGQGLSPYRRPSAAQYAE